MNQLLTHEPGKAELMWRLSAPALAGFGDPDVFALPSQAAELCLRTDSADQQSCCLRDQGVRHIIAASPDISVKPATRNADSTGDLTHCTTVPAFEGCISSDSSNWRDLPEDNKQRKILQNREHQRRFRVKRKVCYVPSSELQNSGFYAAKVITTPEVYDLCQARAQAVQAELAAATAKHEELESHKKAGDNQPTVTQQDVVPNGTPGATPVVKQVSLAQTTDIIYCNPAYSTPRALCASVLPQPCIHALVASHGMTAFRIHRFCLPHSSSTLYATCHREVFNLVSPMSQDPAAARPSCSP